MPTTYEVTLRFTTDDTPEMVERNHPRHWDWSALVDEDVTLVAATIAPGLLAQFARLLTDAADGGLLGLENFEGAEVPTGLSHEKIVELLDAAAQITAA